jgi:hypothetical protein
MGKTGPAAGICGRDYNRDRDRNRNCNHNCTSPTESKRKA